MRFTGFVPSRCPPASGGGSTGTATASVTDTITPTADSYVYDANPDTNYGSATSLQVKYSTTSGYNREAYIKFPISGLDSISDATLRLYGDDNGTTENVSVTTDDSNNNSWTESGITWNNRPTIADADLATVTTSGTTNSWYSWDITSYIQAQITAGASYVTLVMRGTDNSSLLFQFSSKEGANPEQLVITPAANAAPTIATAAAASPSTVTGTTTDLSVLGADDGGESNLTYTWSATSVPAGASAPTFSANGTNAAKDTTATFSAAGSYTFQATATDAGGLTATSSVNVTVGQTLASITPAPGTASLDENATQQFTATGYDQFGTSMVTQPTFTWSNSGVGSVNSTGLYTAPGSTGTATVTATSGSVSGNASVTVGNAAPTVATAAAASPSTVTGTTTSLSGYRIDDGGESNLTYTWTATSVPAATAPTYSANGTNGSKDTTATFTSAGDYTFQVTITDQGSLYVTSSVSVTVDQTLTSISVTPGTPTLGSAATQQFTATGLDQFGVAMAAQPTFTWSNSGSGSVYDTGLYTAPAAAGSDTVTATSGTVSGDTSVTIAGPSVATAGAASTSDGINIDLSALGSDPNGESTLTYTWAASTPDGATVDFTDNSDNGAKSTTAEVDTAGDYAFQVTISDGTNGVTSSVDLTVDQVLTELVVIPDGSPLANSTSEPVAATAFDQFFNVMSVQPTVSWSAQAGSIAGDGTYTAPSTGAGSDTVTASADSVTGTADIDYGALPEFTAGPSASPSTVSGTSTTLSVAATENGSGDNLSYYWKFVGSPPASVTMSPADGDGQTVTAGFEAAGSYEFDVVVSDGYNAITSSTVTVTVSQTLTSVRINQPGAAVKNASTSSLSATAYDQFGSALAAQPTFGWSVSGAGGSIAGDGTYTAPSSGTGVDTVTASVDGVSATTLVETGPIVGTVYGDSNDNSSQDGVERGLSGWTVYIDTNGDGSYESGEPSATTDANGNFALDGSGGGSCGSGSGSATLLAVAQSGWALTQGSSGYSVSTVSGDTSGPELFGAAGGPTVTVTATDSGASEDPIDPGTFTFYRSGDSSDSLPVVFSMGGTAAPGADYTLSGATADGGDLYAFTFAPGETQYSVALNPIANPGRSVGDPSETATASVEGTGAYLGIGNAATIDLLADVSDELMVVKETQPVIEKIEGLETVVTDGSGNIELKVYLRQLVNPNKGVEGGVRQYTPTHHITAKVEGNGKAHVETADSHGDFPISVHLPTSGTVGITITDTDTGKTVDVIVRRS